MTRPLSSVFRATTTTATATATATKVYVIAARKLEKMEMLSEHTKTFSLSIRNRSSFITEAAAAAVEHQSAKLAARDHPQTVVLFAVVGPSVDA